MAVEFAWHVPMLRSGRAKTGQDGLAYVALGEHRFGDEYVITLTVLKEQDTATVQVVKKSAEGFTIEATDKDGEPLRNITVMWACLPEMNA